MDCTDGLPVGPPPFPSFVDNRHGNTLAQALGSLLDVADPASTGELSESPLSEARIATAYFSPAGFAQIADGLAAVPMVRLLLGADLAAQGLSPCQKRLGEPKADFDRRCVGECLSRMTTELRRERDRLPFTYAGRSNLAMLVKALRSGNIEVRRYEKAFLHAKAYVLTGEATEGVLAGSSNLTAAGLTTNLELSLGRDDASTVEQAKRWFDDLWDEAEPYDLVDIFEELLVPRRPWEVFLRVLWQLYGDEVDHDAEDDKNLPLTSFQKHGVARALRLITATGGAIVADEVGLGKTFIAGEILQLYRDRRQRVLLICPAALRDTTWKKFLVEYEIFAESLSYEQLANDVQLLPPDADRPGKEHLQRGLDEYQLVIVDEAHNYRNPGAPTRAATMRRLLFGRRRDLLLLTATPVNNSLWDLYHLIRFFLRQDAHLANQGILSIRGRFEAAMREDPSNLSPDLLYPIIDATTVKRTRQFVRKHYAGDTIPGPDGQPRRIEFPVPHAVTVRYALDQRLPGFFDRLEAALDPDSDDAITFARYTPAAYLLRVDDPEERFRGRAVVGLLRSGLLKRFESSAHAFRKTTQRMAAMHDVFLDALDAGYVVTTAFLSELSADDEAGMEEMLAGAGDDPDERLYSDASLYDVERLRQQVERDRDLLRELAHDAAKITLDRDPKLGALAHALAQVAEQAEREAAHSEDERQKRKVLVFSSYADTVEWIRDYLNDAVREDPGLEPYRGRVATATGSGRTSTESRLAAVQGFAPVSMGAPAARDADRFDLLVSTDVLAEGVNLQQCRHIVNFDMPWNPMRLVQRHGRIDRIGSPHHRVFLRTIFPVDRLDRLLNLEQRILAKLAMAAASVGVAAPIEGAAHGSQVFTETREEIEKLLREDAALFERGGTAGAAQTGEEYRQTLRKALQAERDRIVEMPWKTGSGMVKRGARRGFFFCAVVGHGTKLERTYLRFVPADADWAPDRSAAVQSEVGACLRLIECEEDTPTWFPAVVQERAYDFWTVARKDVWEHWMRETDPANLQPRLRPLNRRVAAFIRDNPPPDVSEDRVRCALEVLESPWPRREEMMLRQWFDASADANLPKQRRGAALSRHLIDQVLDTGLEPLRPPPVLPVIEPAEVELICWLGIEAQESAADGSAAKGPATALPGFPPVASLASGGPPAPRQSPAAASHGM